MITHALVGLGLGVALRPARTGPGYWIACIGLPVVPDLDTPLLGAEGHSACSHRGLSHSLLFAATAAAIVAWVLALDRGRLVASRFAGLLALFALVVASHGVLDAFTDGGSGIMFLWPFSEERFFWSRRPIAVAPLSIELFFSEWGWAVLKSEMRWVWAPGTAVVVAAEFVRRIGSARRRLHGRVGPTR